MLVRVTPDGLVDWGDGAVRCALGRSGVRQDKHEGDGATPAGTFPMRRVLYRGDRLGPPPTGLPVAALAPDDGWCDDPADRLYNRPVSLPYKGRCERLWRRDRLYDVVVVIGHNDDPVVPGAGSAVFIHVARDGYAATAGCIALEQADLLSLLARCRVNTPVQVDPR